MIGEHAMYNGNTGKFLPTRPCPCGHGNASFVFGEKPSIALCFECADKAVRIGLEKMTFPSAVLNSDGVLCGSGAKWNDKPGDIRADMQKLKENILAETGGIVQAQRHLEAYQYLETRLPKAPGAVEFKVGDTVKCNSDGPHDLPMRVITFGRDCLDSYAKCAWSEGNRKVFGLFSLDLLVKIAPSDIDTLETRSFTIPALGAVEHAAAVTAALESGKLEVDWEPKPLEITPASWRDRPSLL